MNEVIRETVSDIEEIATRLKNPLYAKSEHNVYLIANEILDCVDILLNELSLQ